jgi:excisionase family DNA binding protein
MKTLLSTKEVASFLNVNDKMIYSLISDKKLPATKVTGKWLFPRHLVEQWIETNTINYPKIDSNLLTYQGLLIITGSNDPLLDKALSLFNANHPDHVAVFGNLGSMGGLKALRQHLCHMASSHLIQDNEEDYNFEFANQELDQMPAIVNFCRREQGLLVKKGNPENIQSISDLAKPGIRMINRPLGTGTRLLIDRELIKSGIKGEQIKGYSKEVFRHLDVGIDILSGRADVGPGIKAISGLLDLDFVPFRWERFDLMISRKNFFEEGIQLFLGMLHEPAFKKLGDELSGYDLSASGKMVYPGKK